ncbi:type II secretion system GspH family protein [bacterium]|nr:type II secretion system GspH family protein [bacterium]
MRQKAFTLIEVMVAGMIAGAMSLVLMTLLTKFYKNSEQFSGKIHTAQQANIILYHMKMAMRGLASKGEASENVFEGTDAKENQINFAYTESNHQISITYNNQNPRNFGKGSCLGFRIYPLLEGLSFPGSDQGHIFNLFHIELRMDDPQQNGISDLKHALKFHGVVAVRVPSKDKVPDPNWIKNEQSLPSGSD